MRVLPKLDSLDADTLDLGAYLFATERNLFLKSIERAKRQEPVDEVPEPTGPRPLEDDPQGSTLLADQQERVRRANGALAPRQRLVLALRELEDRSYAEIGELVGLKENAVAQLISRARLRLREELRLVEVDRSKLPEECQALLPLLSSYLDGQLEGAAAERTVAHLESCELCQAALAAMREASRLYRALIPIPFPELFEQIDDALASNGFWEEGAGLLRGLVRTKGAWIAAGAVLGAVAMAVAVGVAIVGRDAEPAVAVAQVDTAPPQLVVPEGTIRREATSAAGAPVSFSTRAEDAVDGDVDVSCSPAAGAVFPIGTTEVTCTAQDAAGNKAEDAFAAEVVDSVPPAVSTVDALEVEAKGPEGSPVAFSVRARDRVDTTVPVQCVPQRGDVFPLGETIVVCTARDGAGNVARTRFTVTVLDSTPPVLTLPEALAVEADAPVAYSATANDAVGGDVDVSCSPAAGAVFPIGTTEVTCTAQDAAGNLANDSFGVRVGDTTAPVLRLPGDRTVEAQGPRGTRVGFSASARERGRTLRVRCIPASQSRFPLGRTTVNCSTADAQGNLVRGSFEIVVVDTTAPRLVLPALLTAEATGPSGASVPFRASATDRVDRSVRASCAPASGSTFPLGSTSVRCSARRER